MQPNDSLQPPAPQPPQPQAQPPLPPAYPTPPAKSKKPLIIGLIVAGIVVLVIVIATIVGLMMFSKNSSKSTGSGNTSSPASNTLALEIYSSPSVKMEMKFPKGAEFTPKEDPTAPTLHGLYSDGPKATTSGSTKMLSRLVDVWYEHADTGQGGISYEELVQSVKEDVTSNTEESPDAKITVKSEGQTTVAGYKTYKIVTSTSDAVANTTSLRTYYAIYVDEVTNYSVDFDSDVQDLDFQNTVHDMITSFKTI